jgi:hypothetical protein
MILGGCFRVDGDELQDVFISEGEVFSTFLDGKRVVLGTGYKLPCPRFSDS